MHVINFMCCMPLVWGVTVTGLTYGVADFVLGTVGFQMLIEGDYGEWMVEFFREMPVGYCVAGFSIFFYIMGAVHFMLVYGVYTSNSLLIGSWLLVSFTVFLLTLITGLLSSFAVVRIAIDAYCLILVKSYYETLIGWSSDEDFEDIEETSDESDYGEDDV